MDYPISFKGVTPMVWETNEKKRNVNNECAFSVPDDISLKEGDRITTFSDKENVSVYEITEILEVRPSTLTGRNYVRAKTKWYKEKLS